MIHLRKMVGFAYSKGSLLGRLSGRPEAENATVGYIKDILEQIKAMDYTIRRRRRKKNT